MTAMPYTEVMRANIEVHTRMIDQYNSEPHFRPENQAKVRDVLEDLARRSGGAGCWTWDAARASS